MNPNSDNFIKQMATKAPADLVKLIGSKGEFDRVLPTDLMRIERRPDLVFKLKNPDSILHVEIQSVRDETMDTRIRQYHVVLDDLYYPIPVHSVLILLSPKANSRKITGEVVREDSYFRYTVLRLWEHSIEEGLALPLSILPLAVLFGVGTEEIKEVVARIKERVEKECPPDKQGDMYALVLFFLGSVVEFDIAMEIMKGAKGMEGSVTYQRVFDEGILKGLQQGIQQGKLQGITEGIEKGKIEEARKNLIMIAELKFSAPKASQRKRINSVSDLSKLEDLLRKVITTNSWDELLQGI